MGAEPQGSAFRFTMEVMQHVLGRIEHHGAQNAYVQLLQPAEATDESGDSEMEVERLGRDEARAFLGERIRAGFRGLAAFSCIEEEGVDLYMRVEGFDTGDGRSASARLRLRKTITGKLKAASSNAEVDGFPTIPGIFPANESETT